jgi:hypothetical protein
MQFATQRTGVVATVTAIRSTCRVSDDGLSKPTDVNPETFGGAGLDR